MNNYDLQEVKICYFEVCDIYNYQINVKWLMTLIFKTNWI